MHEIFSIERNNKDDITIRYSNIIFSSCIGRISVNQALYILIEKRFSPSLRKAEIFE
jgi:hypothetical protein